MQVAEYIDLLQLDVARNKKYRMDAEDWEMVPVVAGVIGFDGSFPSQHETFMLMHPLMLKSAQFLFGALAMASRTCCGYAQHGGDTCMLDAAVGCLSRSASVS